MPISNNVQIDVSGIFLFSCSATPSSFLKAVAVQDPECVNWLLALYFKPIILNKQKNFIFLIVLVNDLSKCKCHLQPQSLM